MNVIISAQEYYRWWRDPIIWSAIFAGVIAIETLVYLILTARLWRATKKAAEAAIISAEAAKVSSDASKQSAEIAAGLVEHHSAVFRRVPRRSGESHPQ